MAFAEVGERRRLSPAYKHQSKYKKKLLAGLAPGMGIEPSLAANN